MMARVLALAALAPLLAACGQSSSTVQGYVEGTYVYVSAEAGGKVMTRPATGGATVKAGDVLFTLDDADQKQAVAGAEARLAQANAQLQDMQTGQRSPEIAVLQANLDAARTTLANANDDYARQQSLLQRGVVAQSVVDDAKAKRDAAQAAADAAEQQLAVGQLPARTDQIQAAQNNVAALQSDLDQAKIALVRRTVKAPADGLVEETYFEPGEMVAASQPVVSLLPDANRKVRFFVPERQLASVKVGSEVGVSCDGCAAGLKADVEFVASQAEFTPPILYSKDSRDKLVFRVDARPEGDAGALKVGQPLDVTLAAAP